MQTNFTRRLKIALPRFRPMMVPATPSPNEIVHERPNTKYAQDLRVESEMVRVQRNAVSEKRPLQQKQRDNIAVTLNVFSFARRFSERV